MARQNGGPCSGVICISQIFLAKAPSLKVELDVLASLRETKIVMTENEISKIIVDMEDFLEFRERGLPALPGILKILQRALKHRFALNFWFFCFKTKEQNVAPELILC